MTPGWIGGLPAFAVEESREDVEARVLQRLAIARATLGRVASHVGDGWVDQSEQWALAVGGYAALSAPGCSRAFVEQACRDSRSAVAIEHERSGLLEDVEAIEHEQSRRVLEKRKAQLEDELGRLVGVDGNG